MHSDSDMLYTDLQYYQNLGDVFGKRNWKN